MKVWPTILFLLATAVPAMAQGEDSADVEHTKIVSVTAEPATVKPGEVFHLVFKLRIDPEWHIYAANGKYAPTEWSVEGPVQRAGPVIEPKPKEHREVLGDDNVIEYGYHEGEVDFKVPMRIPAESAPGPLQVKGKITGQECDPRMCIGLDLAFTSSVTVEPHTRIVSVTPAPEKVKPGEKFHLVFKVAIDKDWHIYSANKEWNPTKFEFDAGSPVESAGAVVEPEPRHFKQLFGKDESDGFLEYWKHEGEVTFRVPVKLKAETKPGSVKVSGKLTGQECSTVCIDLNLPFAADLTVEEVAAQDSNLEEHTKIVSLTAEPASAKMGETFHLVFKVRIDPTWHIYSANGTYGPTTWLFDGPLEQAGTIVEPPTKHHREKIGDNLIEYDYHEGELTFRVPVRLTKDAKPGPLTLKGRITGTECDPNSFCVGVDLKFETPITVLEGGVAVDSEFEKHGFLGLILLGVVGGLISLVMPCTYPMIPITLTYFVKQAAGSRRHGLFLSSVYSLGIVIAFTGLGFLLTILMGAGGAREFAANPWVNIVIGLLFLWFTGSLFGWYEIKLPFGLGEKLVQGQRKGAGGAFILGLLFSIVTFTCTIPIAGTILTIAAGQHRLAAAMAMLFYSLTMALPFFLMGLFPAAIREIPRSGGWLQTTKITMAWVELGLATFYFSKADQTWQVGGLNRTVMLLLWIAVALVTAIYLLGMFRKRPGLIRVGFAAVFLMFGGYMAYGFTGKPLGLLEILVPPPPFKGTTLPVALAEGKKEKKPVFAEFTGVT
jgi:cytochrome c biogenesis protein CcdA/DsbC/DsbD-like thiol-disulfide interchange protein